MSPDNWFRSYDYGYVHKGVCLWWAILGDGRLHVAREYVHQFLPIPKICHNIRQITRELGITRVRYTVADKYSMGHRGNDDTGESRGELFAKEGVPVIGANHDRQMGWTRCHALLDVRPDGLPWLTIDPSCRYLIRTISSAVSAKTNPEDVEDGQDDHALSAWRYGAMSRPSPKWLPAPPLPPRAVGRLLRQVRTAHVTRPHAFN